MRIPRPEAAGGSPQARGNLRSGRIRGIAVHAASQRARWHQRARADLDYGDLALMGGLVCLIATYPDAFRGINDRSSVRRGLLFLRVAPLPSHDCCSFLRIVRLSFSL